VLRGGLQIAALASEQPYFREADRCGPFIGRYFRRPFLKARG
jgi:hypothetical protein